MKNCKLREYINKDISNICYALSNPNKYSLISSKCNTNIVIQHAKLLWYTMKYDIKYNVRINGCLVDLWTEAEKNCLIYKNINKYGKNIYLAIILIYFSAKYNTIFNAHNITYGRKLFLPKKSYCCEFYNDNYYRKYNCYKKHRHYYNHHHNFYHDHNHCYHNYNHNDCYYYNHKHFYDHNHHTNEIYTLKVKSNFVEHRTGKSNNYYTINNYEKYTFYIFLI